MNHKAVLFGIALLGCALTEICAQIIHVPADQTTIQEGIDAAENGDTVLVAEGTWYENINFRGKRITVASQFLISGDEFHIDSTIIDGSRPVHIDSASTVTMLQAIDTNSVLCGFTIQGGSGSGPFDFILGGELESKGGGIIHAGGKIVNNIIRDNHIHYSGVVSGGGISGGNEFSYRDTGTLFIIRDNVVYGNSVHSETHYAGGAGIIVNFRGDRCIVENNTIYGNSSTSDAPYKAMGGGLQMTRHTSSTGRAIVRNNYIYDNYINSQYSFGSGIFYLLRYDLPYGDFPATEIYNNVIAGNESNSYGGGICTWYLHRGAGPPPPDPFFVNNTIAGNTAAKGSGLCVIESEVVLMNNIFWNDLPEGGSMEIFDGLFQYCGPTPRYCVSSNNAKVNAAYNDIRGGWAGKGNISSDPIFMDGSFELSDSSECIGKGIDSVEIEENWYRAPAVDYKDDPRQSEQDFKIDIGAFEFQPERDIVFVDGRVRFTDEQIRICPNPVKDILIVQVNKNELYCLEVYSLSGQILIAREFPAPGLELDISNLKPGIYLLTLRSGSRTFTRKIIKQE